MAELAKKLHFLKNGTEQTAKAYSTADEAGSSYIPSKIDGVACYIPIGSISDAMATNGRVIKSSTTYAIKSQAKPAYTEKSWTTPGTYTWTAPAGVTRVRVAVCGGGGGAVGNSFVYTGTENRVTSNYGGTSKFGSLMQATGGGGHSVLGDYDGDGYSNSFTEGSVGSPNGRKASPIYVNGKKNVWSYGGKGFALSFTLTDGSYGNGGNAHANNYGYCAAGGHSGGYSSGYVNVTPSSTYTVVVGAVGTSKSNHGQSQVYDGTGGFVLIAYGGDI